MSRTDDNANIFRYTNLSTILSQTPLNKKRELFLISIFVLQMLGPSLITLWNFPGRQSINKNSYPRGEATEKPRKASPH